MTEQKMKASEKLKMLEDRLFQAQKRVGQLEMLVYNMSRENDVLKEALQLIDSKLNAVVTLTQNGGQLTEDNINDAIMQSKANSLKAQVEEFVNQGTMKPSDEVTKNSFVAIREFSKDGKLVNPRLQFYMPRLVEELQNKFLGKKVGDLVVGPEDRLDGEIMEIYEVVQADQEEQMLPEVPEVEATESTEEKND